MRRRTALLLLLLVLALPALAERYALILEDAPAVSGPRTAIRAAQSTLRRELARRDVPVTGAVERILNAVFVQAAPDRVDELRALPGVKAVVRMRRRTLKLNRAVELMNAPAAWDALGGRDNAGAGVKVAIIDTGIEQTHPAFQDPSLQPPSGFPICQGQDCAFTNGKVIVARSYVAQLAAGTPPTPAADSRPDDFSPRDHVGHGTALGMIVAGRTNTGPAATITGMAPKAWLGNYKVFGSPGLNDGTSSDVIIQALEDALNDGMDIAVLALGGPALTGPTDAGADCGQTPGVACDPESVAVENVVRAGLLVVAAAGNEGDLGENAPTLSTIDAPATSPSVIAAGASTNGHVFINSVRVPGDDVPASLRQIAAIFGDGPLPQQPLTAPARDVTALGDDGTACLGLPRNSLAGAFALIRRGTCTFAQKVNNAQDAGALGVIIYQQQSDPTLFAPSGLRNLNIPAVMIAFGAGTALRDFIATHPDRPVTLDPSLAPADVSTADEVASFTSRGPSIDGAVKPELLAVGTDLYVAAQTYDPEGVMYDPSGYTVQDGTSFAAPMVAGGAALVKQRNPRFTAAQLRSALINTASPQVTEDGNRASIVAAGNGKLDAGAAVNATVTVEPATISFGVLNGASLPVARQLMLTNTSSSTAILSLTVQPRTPDTLARVTLDRNSLTLAAGQSGTLTVTLTGTRPQPGAYEGTLAISGGLTSLRVPYLYAVGDGVPDNIFPLFGFGFSGTVNEDNPDGGVGFRVVDRYGVSVPNVPVRFQVTRGGGRIELADRATDKYGIAAAGAVLGPFAGPQQFVGTAGSLSITFDGSARLKPVITDGGAVNAASFELGQGIAPGSYISLFGTGLSDVTRVATTPYLPVVLGGVSVSFDVPSARISVPGRIYFVSPRQVNVQVPWEIAGQRNVAVKVNVESSNGQVMTLPVATYSPAVFEYSPTGGTRLAAALDGAFNLITSGNPARRGQTVQVYANGLGPVDNPPPAGEAAPASPLARTTAAPAVTIGGRPAAVTFSGLAPGFTGLYQLNITVPADAPTGTQPIVIGIGGVTSKEASIPVQ